MTMEEDNIPNQDAWANLPIKRKALSDGGPESSKRAKTASTETTSPETSTIETPTPKASTTETSNPETRTLETPAKATFFDLPPELRNKIYDLVLISNDQLVRVLPRRPRAERPLRPIRTDPSLLNVCRAIRHEASPMYYGSHAFAIKIHKFFDVDAIQQWIRWVMERCGSNPFKSIKIYIGLPLSNDLEDLRSFIQLFYDTDLQLNGFPILLRESDNGIRSSLFSTYSRGHWRDLWHFRVAEEAIVVAVKAREEGWTEDDLDVEFGRLISEQRAKPHAQKYINWLEERRQGRQRAAGELSTH